MMLKIVKDNDDNVIQSVALQQKWRLALKHVSRNIVYNEEGLK